MTLRIGLLSPWASRLGGGVFEAVVAQTAVIARLGHTPLLFATEDAFSGEDRARIEGSVTTLPVAGPRQIGYAPGMAAALSAAQLDLLHLHGIWTAASHAGASWARARPGRYVISPHGMLDPWIVARGRAKKAVARLGYERRSWRAARVFHALTEREAADIQREAPCSNALVIPNAVSACVAEAPEAKAAPPFLLALGRIHPKKNHAGLIAGWQASCAAASGWQLRIAGWGDPVHVAELERLLAQAADASIAFLGPAFGARKAALLRDAAAFILPSFSEGLPMAVLEAWSIGVPALISPGCNLPEGVAAGCAIPCGTDPVAIAAAVNRFIALTPHARADMADAARALAGGRFSPQAVAEQWRQLYEGLVA